VARAFGLAGPAVPLPGGRGRSWRVGDAVLKPLEGDPVLLEWHAELLGRLDGYRDEFRVSVPLRTRDGAVSAAGWTASRYEPGEPRPRAWRDVLDVGARFHRALRGVPAPAELADRRDPWALADRVAAGGPVPERVSGTPHLAPLLGALRPVDEPSQLVHGDLSGNVLFSDGAAPLVLDFSPYWRPPGFAAAVVVVDALVYDGAPDALIQSSGIGPRTRQHLLRALIFRLVAEHLLGADPVAVARRYDRTVRLVTSLPPE
jgi:uncharacterized protein (TIGR02569 family)